MLSWTDWVSFGGGIVVGAFLDVVFALSVSWWIMGVMYGERV